MLLPNNKSLGFSLIELLIGMTIMAVVIAIGMPSYSAWIQNTRIRTAAESIQNGLQVARAEAVKRNVSVQFVLSDGAAWLVGCETVNSACPAIIQSRTAGEGSSGDITLVTDAASTVVFNNLGAVNASPTPFTRVDVDSSVAAADRPLRITIGVRLASESFATLFRFIAASRMPSSFAPFIAGSTSRIYLSIKPPKVILCASTGLT